MDASQFLASFAPPSTWYWLADDGRLFSGPLQAIITTADPGYIAWTDNGNIATPWPRDFAGNQTDAALQEVLAPFNMFANLFYYAADARWRRQTGGITVTGVTYRTDRVSSNERNSAYNYAKSGIISPVTFQWKLPDGTFVTLDEAQLENVTLSESQFVQACFTCEKNTADSITGGTITTQAQVDSAFAAVSSVFP